MQRPAYRLACPSHFPRLIGRGAASRMRSFRRAGSACACSQPLRLSPLSSLQAGMCDGMTYEEVADKMPGEFALRSQDKLRYRQAGALLKLRRAVALHVAVWCVGTPCAASLWQAQQAMPPGLQGTDSSTPMRVGGHSTGCRVRLTTLPVTHSCCAMLCMLCHAVQVPQRRVLHGRHPAAGAGRHGCGPCCRCSSPRWFGAGLPCCKKPQADGRLSTPPWLLPALAGSTC